MGKIARNYLYNAAYQILVIIAPIITAPYLARVLGAKNLGIYSYVSSSGNIITTISLLGIYAYGNRQTAYVRENKGALTRTFWELELTRLLLGTAGTVIYFIYGFFNHSYSLYFLIYYPYILAEFIDCSWIYIGLEDMKPAVMKNFVTKLINVAGIFLFVRSRNDLWIYILLLAVTTLAANVSIYSQLPKYVGRIRADIHSVPGHLRGSIELFLPQVASLFYLQVDKVMMEWITHSTSQISFYDQAEKIVTIPLSLITVISTVMMPRLANEYQKNNMEEIQNLLLKAGKYALCMALPMMLGLFCIARQFIPWYLGQEFLPTSTAIMILSPIVLLNSLTGISGKQYFTATNQMKILLRAYVTAAVMNVIVNALLIPRFGYVGAAVATVLSSLSSVLMQFHDLKRQVSIGALWKTGCKYLLGAVLMAVCICVFTRNMRARASTTIFQILLGAAVYFGFLLMIKDSIIKEGSINLKRWKMKR